MDSRQLKGGIFLSTLCAIFFFLWGGLLINSQALAGDKTVCPSGCDYTSIQMAINAASSEGGGTVYVGTPGRTTPETYNENFGIMSGVDVVSEGNDTPIPYTGSGHTTTAMERATLTIIDGGGSDSVVRIPGDLSTDVTLDGFTIQNAGVADMFLIRIGGGSPAIKNNIIRNNTGFGGIGLQGFGGEISATIENNLIHNVHGPGIGNGPNSHAMIRNNEIWDCKGGEGVGIGLWGYAHPIIKNNTIFNNSKAGIGSYYSQSGSTGLAAGGNTLNILIQGNTITDNCVGNQCAGIGLERVPGDTGDINVTIGGDRISEGNEISGSGGFRAGIRLDNLTDVKIRNNYVHNHYLGGISLGGVTNAEILDNEISYNQAGIQFDSICANATVKSNEIHDNNQAGIQNGPNIIYPTSGGVDTLIVLDNNIYSNGGMQRGAGIRIQYAGSTNTIMGNEIRDNGKAGIRTELADSVTIKNNEIFRNGEAGIRNDGANTLKVQDNNHIYSNAKAGLSIEWVNSTNIIDGNNTIRENSRGGIRVTGGTSVTVEDNSIYGNGWGGITNQSAADLSVNRNEIVNNGYGGIDIRGGIGEITGNTIRQNTYGGIGIKAPCIFEISDNEIYDNLRGGVHTGDQSADGEGYSGAPLNWIPAELTIQKNKVYGNGQTGYGGGIDVRHAHGIIYNNLVYENHRAGIRFGDYIDEIVNNTVVGNGQDDTGAGIVYDDLAGAVNVSPGGYAPEDIPIKNNICTNNEKAGIRINVGDSGACSANRDYNLLCQNHGITDTSCPSPPPFYCEYIQLYMCPSNPNEIFTDPSFANMAGDDYHLLPGSPAIGAGESGVDMGAYGGSDPMSW